jgi:hypothetical protein
MDSKTMIAEATERATSITPSVIAVAMLCKVSAKDLVHAIDNGNTAVYLSSVVSEFVALELDKTEQATKAK